MHAHGIAAYSKSKHSRTNFSICNAHFKLDICVDTIKEYQSLQIEVYIKHAFNFI